MASDFANEMLKDAGIITGCANYYIFSTETLPLLGKGQMAIPPLNSVMACYYYPYLPKSLATYGEDFTIVTPVVNENLSGVKIIWDTTPPSETDPSTMYFRNPVKVTFQFGESIANRVLFGFSAYPSREEVLAEIGHSNFDWRNEGKLYQYPYRYFEFNDGLMNPMYIEPQYLASNTNNYFRVRQYLNPYGSYECYVDGYKGDFDGLVFPNEVNGLEVPVANDQYLNYLNENKNQRQAAYLSQALNMASGVINLGTGIAHGGLAGSATGVLGISNAFAGFQQQIAKEQDLKRLPNSLSLGGMYQFALQKQQYMYKTVHRINTTDMERIALFFHMYGYQQNKLMIPNIHNRLYWNYIKCNQCNLKGNGIPKEQLTKLKQIFENGTTIWHIDNNAVVGDYSKDNLEVY